MTTNLDLRVTSAVGRIDYSGGEPEDTLFDFSERGKISAGLLMIALASPLIQSKRRIEQIVAIKREHRMTRTPVWWYHPAATKEESPCTVSSPSSPSV